MEEHQNKSQAPERRSAKRPANKAARLPLRVMMLVITAFFVLFVTAHYNERVGILKGHVQIQVDNIAELTKATRGLSASLTPQQVIDLVQEIPTVSMIQIAHGSQTPMAQKEFARNRPLVSFLPDDLQYMTVTSRLTAFDGARVTAVVNLDRLNVSVLSIVLGIGGFTLILVLGAIRLSKADPEEVRAIYTEMELQSLSDKLTGLPNRAGLEVDIRNALDKLELDNRPFSLLVVNIDNFKNVNDSMGYEGGDKILTALANRLKRMLRPTDTLSRTGADEFTLLIDNVAEEKILATVAQEIVRAAASPIHLDGQQMFITVSVGVAQAEVGMKIESLRLHAEAAVTHVKKIGKNTFHVFSNDSVQRFHERVALPAMMQSGLKNNEFFMVYQPILDLKTQRITSFEALARWKHPERGLIMPGMFMPVAEETGMIVDIGEIALRSTCEDLKWLSTQLDTAELSAAVNLSIHQFKRRTTADRLAEIVESSGVPKGMIHLEITESTMMESVETSVSDLDRLLSHGFPLSIDDFGTGYSSLARLKEIDVKKLKIDRSFITKIHEDNGNRAIVTAIIQMAHSMGMKVVAEGVETLDEAILVRSLGCDELQGYLISRPVPITQVKQLLMDYNIIKETFNFPGSDQA